jgi:hypothetical protein
MIMKKTKKLFCTIVVIIAAMTILAGYASAQQSGGGARAARTVAPKYQFTNGWWSDSNWGDYNSGSTAALSGNRFTVTGRINISYNNVRTEGGGAFYWDSEDYPSTWRYLYAGSSKIGVVYATDDGDWILIILGRDKVRADSSAQHLNLDTSDMQNRHNGFGGVNPEGWEDLAG